MSACCYIIYSQKLKRFYTGGATQENILERIQKHNEHSYGQHRFTAAAKDWTLFLEIPTNDFPHAVRMEQAIKAMKSSVYIQNLKKYPELLQKVVDKTSN